MSLPKSNWVLHLYSATVDSATSNYTEVLLSTIAGYTGYTTTSCSIIAPQNTPEFSTSTFVDVSGWESGSSTLRDVFNVELWPFKYTDHATLPDLTDWVAIANFIKGKKYLWARMVGGSRNYPTDATKAYPVVISTVNESVNKTAGTHNVTLGLRVRGLL